MPKDPVNWRFNPFTETYSAVQQSNEDKAIPASSPYQIRLDEVPRQDSPSSVDAVILGTLDEDLDISEQDVDVVAAEYGWFQVNDVILIDSEQMLVTAKPGSPTLTVTRGYGGTSAATHSTGTDIEILDSLTEISSGSPAAREYRVDYKYNTGLVLFNSAQSGYNVRFDYWGLGSPLFNGLLVGDGMLPLLSMAHEDTVSTDVWTDTDHQIKFEVPAQGPAIANLMARFKNVSGGSYFTYVRLNVDGLTSSNLSTNTVDTFDWYGGPVTLDLSSKRGQTVVAKVQMSATATSTGTIINSHAWLSWS